MTVCLKTGISEYNLVLVKAILLISLKVGPIHFEIVYLMELKTNIQSNRK